MTGETWRPLGVDTEDDVAEYDALYDGIPKWMDTAYWEWVRRGITGYSTSPGRSGRFEWPESALLEEMCQRLQIPLSTVRSSYRGASRGRELITGAMRSLRAHSAPLQIADYLLAHGGGRADRDQLDALLERSKSAWTVGTRGGRPGLVRRVPLGVQVAADAVMARAGKAGVRLAKAWEELYALTPNASEAYRLAILAVEDASIPVVSPSNSKATLGTVLKQIEDQKDWRLPMSREHPSPPSGEVLVGMMRMLWHGQHDRHGGQPSAPGNVSREEATLAVSLAVALVQWFDAGLVQRKP